jgi:hypothetical protein
MAFEGSWAALLPNYPPLAASFSEGCPSRHPQDRRKRLQEKQSEFDFALRAAELEVQLGTPSDSRMPLIASSQALSFGLYKLYR